MPRIPLSADLASAPFLASAAEAEGWGAKRLRGPDLARPFHGIRSASACAPERAYAPRLRAGDRFSHTSAARIWGAPLPLGRGDPVHLSTADPSRVRTRGVVGHRSRLGRTVTRFGLPVSDPASTFREVASLLPLADLVAVGDSLVLVPRVIDPADPRPFLTPEDLRVELRRRGGRGIQRARTAADLVRVGAESAQETRLRLLARDTGLPEPELQYELLDRHGSRIGWFDLAWPEARLIAEYDGDQHRTSAEQYERDIRRFDRAAEEGWHVLRVRKRGLAAGSSDTRIRLTRLYRERS